MVRVAEWVLMVALILGVAGGQTAISQAAAPSQAAAAVPETSVGAVLRNLASRAGVVFVGQVVRIERNPGTVEVVFQVQQSVLGTVGATYTLREWGGLWAGGQQRYRLGERAMVFLHAPRSGSADGSATGEGLSSPVDGMDGVVPVVVQGANAAALLDVRWLAARVLRAEGAPIADAGNDAITLAEGTAVVAGWQSANLPEPVRRPLPVGVRPAQPEPVLSAGPSGTEGNTPLPMIGVVRPSGVHDTVLAAAPGGPDAIR